MTSRIDYKKIDTGIGADPIHKVEMYCDNCKVRWDGCWDNFSCPICGNGDPPWLDGPYKVFQNNNE